jgi:hypothetical protein
MTRVLHDLANGFFPVALAVLFFVVAFAVHVVLWRAFSALPSNSTLVALLVAVILGECLIGVLAVSSWTMHLGVDSVAVAGVLALQLAACYVMTYPAMQANSPTLEMAHQLSAAGPGGLTRDELYRLMPERSLVLDRVDDLVTGHLAVEHEDRLCCTASGVALAQVFTAWKAILGEGKGG